MNYAETAMTPKNSYVYNLAVAMELTILDCEEMGLEIERVEFDGRFRPRIFVKNSAVTEQLFIQGKAQHFGSFTEHGVRYYHIQMPNRECKILWKTDRLH